MKNKLQKEPTAPIRDYVESILDTMKLLRRERYVMCQHNKVVVTALDKDLKRFYFNATNMTAYDIRYALQQMAFDRPPSRYRHKGLDLLKVHIGRIEGLPEIYSTAIVDGIDVGDEVSFFTGIGRERSKGILKRKLSNNRGPMKKILVETNQGDEWVLLKNVLAC